MIVKLTKESEIGNGNISASKKQLIGDCASHWHEFYEIEYVIDGGGECLINNRTFEMKSGMLFFMTPVDFHTVKQADATVINVMFSPEMAAPDILFPFTSFSAPKAMEIPQKSRNFIETILNEIVKNKDKIQFCEALINTLLLKFGDNFNLQAKDTAYSSSQKMTFYIINHFREKITLNEIAAAAGLTPSYASAVFKYEMQINFKEYLDNIRFDYAKKLLNYSSRTVLQICCDSGFEDYPNFIRRFKLRFGESPTNYRKKHLKTL
ncbi:MAG: helix-turn-helix transcriptional regulator [Clostridia bacterium]|nr:helix-turn-helix transcriptional regulator [Clostridia bacterium]